jgi:hypothetical protein
MVIQVLTTDFWKQMKLNCGAERHHYSMFNVGRSTFIFQNNPARHRCTTRMFTKQPSAYGTPQPVAPFAFTRFWQENSSRPRAVLCKGWSLTYL